MTANHPKPPPDRRRQAAGRIALIKTTAFDRQ